MANPGSGADRAKNRASGGSIINTGKHTNSPIINVIGDHNTSTNNVQMPDPRIARLRFELDQARCLLKQYQSLEHHGDREAAIIVVDAVETAVTDQQTLLETGKLRSRLDGLIAVLTPLIGVVEGIAASIEVFKDIRAAF